MTYRAVCCKLPFLTLVNYNSPRQVSCHSVVSSPWHASDMNAQTLPVRIYIYLVSCLQFIWNIHGVVFSVTRCHVVWYHVGTPHVKRCDIPAHFVSLYIAESLTLACTSINVHFRHFRHSQLAVQGYGALFNEYLAAGTMHGSVTRTRFCTAYNDEQHKTTPSW